MKGDVDKQQWTRILGYLVGVALFVVGLMQCQGSSEPPAPEASKEKPVAEVPERRNPPEPEAKAFPTKWNTVYTALTKDSRPNYPYARGIVHIHSIHSHDACDGKPRVDGKINAPCLKRLRDALCQTHIDVTFLTEHRSLMAEGDPLKDIMLYQEGDTPIVENGQRIGNQMNCPDGHVVTIFPGAENALMPVALKRHPTPKKGQTLEQLYNDRSSDAIQRFKEAGAAVIVNHTEGQPLEYLQSHNIHGIEVFNLHAILDPRIRKADLNLPQQGALEAFLPYLHPEDMLTLPHPDMAFLGFHEPLKVIVDKWDKLLAKKMVYGYGGTDAHENVIKSALRDGDRPDSYSRMMRWFSNHFRVPNNTWKAYREAMFSGNSIVVFEILGTPEVFEFYGMTKEGKRVEMGATQQKDIQSLHVEASHPYQNGEERVVSQIKLIHIRADGSKDVKEGEGNLTLKEPKPGMYRVEVWVTPKHLKKILTSTTMKYIKPSLWIYSNPIQVVAP